MEKLVLCRKVEASWILVPFAISFLLSGSYSRNVLEERKQDLNQTRLLSSSTPSIADQDNANHQRHSESKIDKAVEINYLHIYSDIRFRYARTRVLTEITNHANAPVNTSYFIKIPKDQFVTEFTIEKSGIEFKGKTEIVDNVEKYLNASSVGSIWNQRRQNRTLGVVQLCESPKNRFSQFDTYKMIIFLRRKEELNVTFVYEGLVHKIPGNHILLSYELNIKPQEMSRVKSFEVKLNIMESKLSVPWLSNIRGKRDPSKLIPVTQKTKKVGEENWEISWRPNDAELKELIAEDVLGAVKIMYNIEPQLNTENQVVVVRDGYLAYLDDRSLQIRDSIGEFHETLLPRHVVFILDVSGSMEGHRLEQLKLGMKKILNMMKSSSNYKNTRNFIDIVTFSNKITVWAPLGTTEDPHPLVETFKSLALNYIQNLKVGGSTNIFAALQEGLRLANRARSSDLEAKSIIFFVTDGEPTSGLIDADEIRRRVKRINEHSGIPIYSLAFGSEADFGFCRNISSDTKGGLARKIFDLDTEDAANSFEMFYKEIASPSLQNVTFVYTTPVHYVNEVTHARWVSVQFTSIKTEQRFHAIKFDSTAFEIPCAEHCLMERIFALRKIKKLYKLSHNQTSTKGYCSRAQVDRRSRDLATIREANNLASKHNFLSPCTSLVIQELKPLARQDNSREESKV